MTNNNNLFKQMYLDIDACLCKDRHHLKQALNRIKHQRNGLTKSITQLKESIEASVKTRILRQQAIPLLHFPDHLPVNQQQEIIIDTIQQHQVTIICGETGSGKTTQLPKLCLAAGQGSSGLIGHTQPRRIAARSVAARIAEELNSVLGTQVGYKIRFHDKTTPNAYIKVMTDGILLAEIKNDRYLKQYDTLIIDEAHERSLNIDFLLGYLKWLLPRRPDLKLLITSATIDPESFSRHFNQAPIIEVSGRTYPIDIRYRPPFESSERQDSAKAIIAAIDEINRETPGDILIFLSGERDIRETARQLYKHHLPKFDILPLYSKLNFSEQQKVFQKAGKQRIILATNVAETSITVPGITAVIDPGKARISRYNPTSKVQRLPIENISQASANQRAGRCGRVCPGICIRLYSEEDYLSRETFTQPEIKRTNLASIILQMKQLKLSDISQFPFIEPPQGKQINDGIKLLIELNALDQQQQITQNGIKMAHLMIDPRLARMLLVANQEHCLTEMLIITSGLSIQDPRERPLEHQQKADEFHSRFNEPASDFISWLKLWQFYTESSHHLSNNKLRKRCQNEFLSYTRLCGWQDIHNQLKSQVREMGLTLNQHAAQHDQIHRALLAGLISQVARYDEEQLFVGVRGRKFNLFPGSVLAKKTPQWIISGELVETSRLYARMNAKIEPEWIEQAAKTLIKHHYFDPFYDPKSGNVVAFEATSLYGLTITHKRKINYGPANPDHAREIFIQSALIERTLQSKMNTIHQNFTLIEDIESLENKDRRKDILIEDHQLLKFYKQQIPAHICSQHTFEIWLKTTQQKQPDILKLSPSDLLKPDRPPIDTTQYPDFFNIKGNALALTYHFDPSNQCDGITITIPVLLLNQLTNKDFEWLVPGFIKDKIIALIKSLPKTLRKSFVPAPDYAQAFLESIQDQQSDLLSLLSKHLLRMTGVKVAVSQWQEQSIPEYLKMKFSLVDDNHHEIAVNKDLHELQTNHSNQIKQTFQKVSLPASQPVSATHWSFGTLADKVTIKKHNTLIQAYPTLEDHQDHVILTMSDNPTHASQKTRQGLRRLFLLQAKTEIKFIKKNMPHIKTIHLFLTRISHNQYHYDQITDDIINLAADQIFPANADIRNEQQFNDCVNQQKKYLAASINQVCTLLNDIIQMYQPLIKKLESAVPLTWINAVKDIKQQLNELLHPEFLQKTAFSQIQQFPRYLKAITIRLNRLSGHLQRDQEQNNIIQHYLQLYQQSDQDPFNPELNTFRWLIEELRVSLFSQELKTPYPVSVKRLDQQWHQYLEKNCLYQS